MLIHCNKTGKMYDINLEFQQVLKDAWATSVLKLVTKVDPHQHKQLDKSAVNTNDMGKIVL
jgi:hypothetical protein